MRKSIVGCDRKGYTFLVIPLVAAIATLLATGKVIAGETLVGICGLLVLAAAIFPPYPSRPLRWMVVFFAIILLAFGGWFNLESWQFERAKPSPHYLGLPKIP